jgi:hypothetical protein
MHNSKRNQCNLKTVTCSDDILTQGETKSGEYLHGYLKDFRDIGIC